jgi:hypothetical protein
METIYRTAADTSNNDERFVVAMNRLTLHGASW